MSSREAHHITLFLEKGVSLYNLTRDGQGIGYKPTTRLGSEFISRNSCNSTFERDNLDKKEFNDMEKCDSSCVETILNKNQKREEIGWALWIIFIIVTILVGIFI